MICKQCSMETWPHSSELCPRCRWVNDKESIKEVVRLDQMQKDCEAICEWCKQGVPLIRIDDDIFGHRHMFDRSRCDATAIRVAWEQKTKANYSGLKPRRLTKPQEDGQFLAIKPMIILGATGMLGRQLVKLFPKEEHFNSKDFDFAEPDDIYRFANSLNPNDLVINACGLLRQHLSNDPTPDEYKRAINLNCLLPQVLSWRCRLIHISSDCVFEGTQNRYTELSLPDGKDLYARSKALGEAPTRAMVIRTSIIGKEDKNHKGLMAWFLKQDKANGFTNHFWNGMTTNELARCIKMIVDNNWWAPGLLHLHSNTVSKYELLQMINQHRANPAVLSSFEAATVVDRTLSTINNWFLEQFNVRPLSEQIEEAMKNE